MGSISLEKNLREVLSQLDFSDLKPFFAALDLTFPAMPRSFATVTGDGERLFWVEILVRELKAKESTGESLALFPTEEDLWQRQASDESKSVFFSSFKEFCLFQFDSLLREETRDASVKLE